MLNRIGIQGTWRSSQHHKLFLHTFYKPLPNKFCSLAELIILPLTLENTFFHKVFLVCNTLWVGVMCQSKIHMNARSQAILAKWYPYHHTAYPSLITCISKHNVAMTLSSVQSSFHKPLRHTRNTPQDLPVPMEVFWLGHLVIRVWPLSFSSSCLLIFSASSTLTWTEELTVH